MVSQSLIAIIGGAVKVDAEGSYRYGRDGELLPIRATVSKALKVEGMTERKWLAQRFRSKILPMSVHRGELSKIPVVWRVTQDIRHKVEKLKNAVGWRFDRERSAYRVRRIGEKRGRPRNWDPNALAQVLGVAGRTYKRCQEVVERFIDNLVEALQREVFGNATEGVFKYKEFWRELGKVLPTGRGWKMPKGVVSLPGRDSDMSRYANDFVLDEY